MNAAEDLAIFFNAVTDNPASTVRTLGRQGVYRALEAVEYVRCSREGHLEGLVVVVSANFTESHKKTGFDKSSFRLVVVAVFHSAFRRDQSPTVLFQFRHQR